MAKNLKPDFNRFREDHLLKRTSFCKTVCNRIYMYLHTMYKCLVAGKGEGVHVCQILMVIYQINE